MAKKNDTLVLELSWEIPHTEKSEFAKFLNIAILSKLHGVRQSLSDTGMRYYATPNIVTETGVGVKAKIIFEQWSSIKSHSILGNARHTRRNFNNLVKALNQIDYAMSLIPESCLPKAVLSTKNYRSPIVQVFTNDVRSILLRDDADSKELYNLGNLSAFPVDEHEDNSSIKIKNIRVVGERREVYKVKRILERWAHKPGTESQLAHALQDARETRRNDRWAVIVTSVDSGVFVYGNTHLTRSTVYKTMLNWSTAPFQVIKHKYPNRPFAGDLVVHPL